MVSMKTATSMPGQPSPFSVVRPSAQRLRYFLPLFRAALLKAEEESVQLMCEQIIAMKPDVVITEKGLSDLAAHFLTKVRAVVSQAHS